MTGLSSLQVEDYWDQGVVHPIHGISETDAEEYLQRFAALQSRMGDWLPIKQIQKSYLVEPWVDQLIRHPNILAAVGNILGPDLYVWGATFFAKPPQSGGYVGWHQDLRYWGLTPCDEILTVWLALSDAHRDNGCMAVLPGSHKFRMREHLNLAETGNMLQSGQEIELTQNELSTVVDAELSPGQFSIHHSMAIHGSNPNQSNRARVGLSMNFISAKVQQTLGADSAMRVQGKTHPWLAEEPRPDASFSSTAIENYTGILKNPSSFGLNSPDWNALFQRIN